MNVANVKGMKAISNNGSTIYVCFFFSRCLHFFARAGTHTHIFHTATAHILFRGKMFIYLTNFHIHHRFHIYEHFIYSYPVRDFPRTFQQRWEEEEWMRTE